MGDVGIGHAIRDAVRRVKAENPDAMYCCDPVIGDDDTDVYVRAGIPEMIRDEALPCADIITPNHFELRHLTGLPCDTLAGAKRAVERLQALGPRTVLVSSLRTEATPASAIHMLGGAQGAWPRL